jgi:hypothetical protein
MNRFASMQREYPDSSLDSAMNTGFGGLPNPIGLLASYVAGKLPAKLDQRLTMPRTTTFTSTANPRGTRSDQSAEGTAFRSYLTFDLVNVGANSRFGGLTAEQREELGGVEYRVRFSSALLRRGPLTSPIGFDCATQNRHRILARYSTFFGVHIIIILCV